MSIVDATTFHDHYPGGWQVNLPVAGYMEGFYEVPYGLHGESAFLPFDPRASLNSWIRKLLLDMLINATGYRDVDSPLSQHSHPGSKWWTNFGCNA